VADRIIKEVVRKVSQLAPHMVSGSGRLMMMNRWTTYGERPFSKTTPLPSDDAAKFGDGEKSICVGG